MESAKILFVDDELSPDEKEPNGDYMWYYVKALEEAGHEITRAMGPDEALVKLSAPDADFDLAILDVMMPPEQAYEEAKTLSGTRTGFFLAQTMAQKYADIPIFVLTNVDDPSSLNLIRGVKSVEEVATKGNCTPFQLVDHIQEM